MQPAPRPPRLRLLLGALAALALGLLALLAQGGASWASLWAAAGPTHLAVALTFALALGLGAGPVATRLAARPLLPLLVGLAPLGAAALIAGLTAGNLPGMDDLKGHCDLLLAISCEAHLLWALGLAGAGVLWLGALAALWPRLPPAPDGSLRGRAPLLAAGALWSGALAAAFLDGLMPERGAVGGAAARGLWPLALGLPAVLGAAQALRRAGVPGAAGPALAAAWAWAGGGLALSLAGHFAARAWGLGVLAFELEGVGALPVWPGDALEASLVAATALRWLGPALALVLAVAAGVGLWRGAPAVRRQALGLAGGAGVAAMLAVAMLVELGAAFEERCGGLRAPGLELPEAAGAVPWADAGLPVLAVLPGGLLLDGEPLDPAGPRLPSPAAPEASLLLAIDRGADSGRLLDAMAAAGRAGWGRFGLLLRPPPPAAARCALERRVFGLCLSARVDGLGALSFGGPDQAAPAGPGRLVANLVVGAADLELEFGGFGPGTAPAELEPLRAVFPREGGLGTLAAALDRARARFPESRAARVVIEDRGLGVAALAGLLEVVRGGGARFPELALADSTR